MKIYEKPMAIINKFEVEDVIAASEIANEKVANYVADTVASQVTEEVQGVIFQW